MTNPMSGPAFKTKPSNKLSSWNRSPLVNWPGYSSTSLTKPADQMQWQHSYSAPHHRLQ